MALSRRPHICTYVDDWGRGVGVTLLKLEGGGAAAKTNLISLLGVSLVDCELE